MRSEHATARRCEWIRSQSACRPPAGSDLFRRRHRSHSNRFQLVGAPWLDTDDQTIDAPHCGSSCSRGQTDQTLNDCRPASRRGCRIYQHQMAYRSKFRGDIMVKNQLVVRVIWHGFGNRRGPFEGWLCVRRAVKVELGDHAPRSQSARGEKQHCRYDYAWRAAAHHHPITITGNSITTPMPFRKSAPEATAIANPRLWLRRRHLRMSMAMSAPISTHITATVIQAEPGCRDRSRASLSRNQSSDASAQRIPKATQPPAVALVDFTALGVGLRYAWAKGHVDAAIVERRAWRPLVCLWYRHVSHAYRGLESG